MTAIFWKELRENIWRMTSIAIILLVSLAFYIWHSSGRKELLPTDWVSIWTFASFVTPVWCAAVTATSEKSQHTSSTLDVLPINSWITFTLKTICGIATFLIPLALPLFLGLWLFPSQRSPWDTPDAWTYEGLLLASPMIYLLTLCFTVRVRNEGFAAMIGVLLLLCSALWLVLAITWMDHSAGKDYPYFALLLNPFSFALYVSNEHHLTEFPISMLFSKVAVTTGYWLLAGFLYCNFRHRSSVTSSRLNQSKTEKIPTRILKLPLAWKERREQLSVLISAVFAGFGLAAFEITMDNDAWYSHHAVLESVALLSMIGRIIPSFVAVILGVAAIAGDLNGKLTDFWESRPISATCLFWTKTAFAFLGTLALSLIFEAPYAIYSRFEFGSPSSNSHIQDVMDGRSVVGPLIWLAFILAMTLLLAGVLRRPTYIVAAVALLAITILLVPVTNTNLILVDNVGLVIFKGDSPYMFAPVIITLMVATAIMSAGAWLVFTHRWRIAA